MWKVLVFVVLFFTRVLASCPKDCRCPPEAPTCEAGVSLVVDSCGCCEVCGRQLFEDCSKTQQCDHTKGLECNFGGGPRSAKGICRAKLDGRTCEYSGKIYQNGEIFRPNCKHQCTCMDGAVGCVSLCPHELLLPKPGCFRPERVKARGRCCELLTCPEVAKAKQAVVKKHSRDKASGDDLSKENELAPAWRGRAKSLAAFMTSPVGHMAARGVNCVSQTSAWSPCSKSCGAGVSRRTTNNNSQCKRVTETRICEIRPCYHRLLSTYNKRQESNHTQKARHPVTLWHSGCRSLKKFQPKYCEMCSDGRCCRPRRSRTAPVRFRCANGEIAKRKVMMIEACECDVDC